MKMHRRQSSISSKGDDYLLDDNYGQSAGRNSCWEGQPPRVVTVSARTELQSSLRQRDARIALLEQELVNSRLQLASAKATQDNLSLELSRTISELADTRSALADSRSKNYSTIPSMVSASTASTSTTTNTSTRQPNPSAIYHPTTPSLFGLSLKREIGSGCGMKPMNPGSCASGLNIISGVAQSDICSNSNMIPSNGSTSSFYRKLGSTVEFSSEESLQKRKSGDLAVDSRRMNAVSASNMKNEGWGNDVPMARPQGNMFLNFLLSSRVPEGEPSTTAEVQRFYTPTSKSSSTTKL
jgi:hypothetical protein